MSEAALVLFWPALLGYAEAAFAYAGETLRPGRASRFAIWGVRVGWLAQTGLLIAQAVRADGFPWSSWAASLNLFVWMCVGCYLIWGCRAPYRLLGLLVMPLAVLLLGLAWASGADAPATRDHFGAVFLSLHVGLVLAAFAGFTIAAGLAAVYLWQSSRLKRHAPGVLRVRAPSLATLDGLIGRTIAVALPVLAVGAGIGFARLEREAGRLDATMGITVATLVMYAAILVVRHEAGWRGRRSAYLALCGFLLVVAIRVGLSPFAHF